jgi:hypothetical protein
LITIRDDQLTCPDVILDCARSSIHMVSR